MVETISLVFNIVFQQIVILSIVWNLYFKNNLSCQMNVME